MAGSSPGAPVATRYNLLSRVFDAAEFLACARAQWSIETALHWTLEVHLAEDQNRSRRDNSPANIAILNRFARNLLERAEHGKTPISKRITKSTFSDEYLMNAIGHMR